MSICKWLIYGGKGWIGSQVIDILKERKQEVYLGEYRVDDVKNIEKEITDINPDNIICLIGRTHGEGCNTIDYLEGKGKLKENINDNLFSPLVLAILAEKYDKHLTYMGTGCIFSYNEDTPDSGYHEDSLPDFFGSSYSIVKGFTDRLIHMYDKNVLNVRIRMPIIDSHNERNFITKITKYDKVVNIPNSMTVLPELLPYMLDLASVKYKGTINLTNPGSISHNQVLELYKKHVDPEFTWSNFTLEEQNKILASKRSNNLLDTTKLQLLFPQVKNIYDSLDSLLSSFERSN